MLMTVIIVIINDLLRNKHIFSTLFTHFTTNYIDSSKQPTTISTGAIEFYHIIAYVTIDAMLFIDVILFLL